MKKEDSKYEMKKTSNVKMLCLEIFTEGVTSLSPELQFLRKNKDDSDNDVVEIDKRNWWQEYG